MDRWASPNFSEFAGITRDAGCSIIHTIHFRLPSRYVCSYPGFNHFWQYLNHLGRIALQSINHLQISHNQFRQFHSGLPRRAYMLGRMPSPGSHRI